MGTIGQYELTLLHKQRPCARRMVPRLQRLGLFVHMDAELVNMRSEVYSLDAFEEASQLRGSEATGLLVCEGGILDHLRAALR